ncbi:hypothetical protein KUCAC02_036719 [Chaenocephalus aceratus]|nr:hypothetical protein KUCAC02_036719 [Chaenocephalus aceratus]
MGLLACNDTLDPAKENNLDSTATTATEQSDDTLDPAKEGNLDSTATTATEQSIEIQEAFDQVVKVLQAPYAKGDKLFRYITMTDMIHDSKNGSESTKIGKSTQKGSGTWTVKAAIPDIGKEENIVYAYNNYQPNGSDIRVNGTMTAMYRRKIGIRNRLVVTSDTDGIGFNKVALNNLIDFEQDDPGIIALKNTYNTTEATHFASAISKAFKEAKKIEAAAKAAVELAEKDGDTATKKAAADTLATAIANTETAGFASGGSATYKAFNKAFNAHYFAIKNARDHSVASGIGQHIDTLKIDGAYEATLQFIYIDFTIQDFPMTSAEYNEFLIKNVFQYSGAYVTFNYKDETITLNPEQLEKLLVCSFVYSK